MAGLKIKSRGCEILKFTTKYLIAAVFFSFVVGVWFYSLELYGLTGFMKALDGILLLSSICLGFYSACLSVFASIFNTKAVRQIMQDKHYRKEFVLISSSSLIIGFLTVITTIIFQVMIENKDVSELVLKITNGLWGGLVFIFFSLQLIFVFVSFLIFFNNAEANEEDLVHTPRINEE